MAGFGSVVVIGGLAGTGSTTVAKVLSAELGREHVYGGGIFRAMAAEAGRPLEEYMTEMADRPEVERRVDRELVDRARGGDVVLESRVLGWILPGDVPAYRVWLTCELPERSRRIDDREATADALERIAYRDGLDARRYAALYGLDLGDLSPYDRVIDTTETPAGAVARAILAELQSVG